MNECFTKLNLKLSKDNPIWKEYRNYECDHLEITKYYPEKENTENSKLSDTFKQAWLPIEWFEKEEQLYNIMQKYDLKPKLFLVEAGYCYNWHKDGFRSITLNVDLDSGPDYMVLYSDNKHLYTPITRLEYEPGSVYLLNTQKFHISINYGKTDRYILTLSKFEKQALTGSPQQPYLEILQDLKDQGLVDV